MGVGGKDRERERLGSPHKWPALGSFDMFFDINLSTHTCNPVAGHLTYYETHVMLVECLGVERYALLRRRKMQYIPRIIHRLHALLCFAVVWHRSSLPFSIGFWHGKWNDWYIMVIVCWIFTNDKLFLCWLLWDLKKRKGKDGLYSDH